MSNLFIDDVRNPNNVKAALHRGVWEEFPSLMVWEVVRSYDEFVAYILKNGLPKRITFDHDLSWEHYPKGLLASEADIDYSKYKEKTGYDCAKWLTEYCMTNNLELPDFYIHSFNPVGRMNISNHLLRFEEIQAENKKTS
jgi:hypothetical protein